MLFGMAYGAYVNSPTTSPSLQVNSKQLVAVAVAILAVVAVLVLVIIRRRFWIQAQSGENDTRHYHARRSNRIFCSCFTAVRLYSKAARDIDDYLNYVFAGGLTSGLTGLAIPGSRAKGLSLRCYIRERCVRAYWVHDGRKHKVAG